MVKQFKLLLGSADQRLMCIVTGLYRIAAPLLGWKSHCKGYCVSQLANPYTSALKMHFNISDQRAYAIVVVFCYTCFLLFCTSW